MKITGVRAHVLEAALSEPFAYSRAWYAKRTSLIVEIETDQGLVGWGECYGPARINAAVVRELGASLVGQDALRSEFLWHDIYARYRDHGQKGSIIQGLSGIDIALWDLKGKFFGQPVHRLMGGPIRNTVMAYATGLYRRESGDPTAYLAEEAARYCAQGFTAVKLKVGFGVEDDTRAAHAVRAAIGVKAGLMIDANHAYDAVAAIRLGRRIEALDIGWFEEPVPPEDVAGHLQVKSALSIPIAGGESVFNRFDYLELAELKAVDIMQPDLAICGGITEGLRIGAIASAFNLRLAPHLWTGATAFAAGLHLAATSPAAFILEYSLGANPLLHELAEEGFPVKDGYVDIPDRPGLGVTINGDFVKRFAVF